MQLVAGRAQVAQLLPDPERHGGPKPKHGGTLKVAFAYLPSPELVSSCAGIVLPPVGSIVETLTDDQSSAGGAAHSSDAAG